MVLKWRYKSGCIIKSCVNVNLQVLDKKQNVIEGLYAAGVGTGGLAGEYQFQTPICSGIGTALMTGFVAGDNASHDKTAYTPSPFA